jgi:peptidoglycan/xylan/chitin deacetylase (PgdA/CDA1 family)
MAVSVTPGTFERALTFLTTYYNPISLEDVLGVNEGRQLPPRPVLVTFDDGYASARAWAAPLCARFGVPAVFFLNAAFLDNAALAPDNLVCYVANVLGMETINAGVRAVKGVETPKLRSLAAVFSQFFPSISLTERRVFLETLVHLGRINEPQLAREAGLYLARKDVSELADAGFEIGNHTYTHVRCRSLSPRSLGEEIDRNKAELEGLSGRQVKSFSVPYGSLGDLTSELVAHLRLSGHQAAFLSESVANSRTADRFQVDRVSGAADGDDNLFFEIEVLPRLRAIRDRFVNGNRIVPRGWGNSALTGRGDMEYKSIEGAKP